MSDHLLSDPPDDWPEETGAGGFGRDDIGRVVWIPGTFDERSWRGSATCRDVDPAVFFPVGSTGRAVQQIADAKAICRGCPVRLVCLQFALTTNQEDGVWGGYSEDERRELRRRWRRLGRPTRFVPGGSLGATPGDEAVAHDSVGRSDWAPEAS
jgi:WhiB family redox-sensing transcriptional regulator